jgi:DNA polymerase-3 subunit alpha
MELLGYEKKAIGFYVSGHPLENYEGVLAEAGAKKVAELEPNAGENISIGGIATGIQIRNTKKGARFALLRLEDDTGGVKCVLWPEMFTKYQRLIVDEAAVLFRGAIDVADDDSISIIVNQVDDLDSITQTQANALIVNIPEAGVNDDAAVHHLQKLLCDNTGDCQVFFDFTVDGLVVRMRPHGTLRVKGTPMLESSLVKLGYRVEWLKTLGKQ